MAHLLVGRQDLHRVIETRAVDVVNIKIMKSGVFEAMEIAHTAGMRVMFVGMVETRLAMASGLDAVQTLDLDTPLLMITDPIDGGSSTTDQ